MEVVSSGFAQPQPKAGFLHAIRVLLKYRTVKNYKSVGFVAPRFGDKIFFSLLIMSLYWGIGDEKDAQVM
jgi:hypothetical protein